MTSPRTSGVGAIAPAAPTDQATASPPRDPDNLKWGEEGFFPAFFAKLSFTLISVKVWGLVAGTWVSSHLVLIDKITGTQWVTFNTTVWGLIFGMKEVFKIAAGREKADAATAEKQLEVKKETNRVQAMITSAAAAVAGKASPSGLPATPLVREDGMEVVADEPDPVSA